MEPISTHTGVGVPLRRSDVDTDQILPARFLKRVTRAGFEEALFADWRADERFVLNDTRYSGGSVLVAGADFGTGSSREHAVWALHDYGFQVVISPRFADIFRGNAGKRGLVTAQCGQPEIETLWQALENRPGTEITVDLAAKTIRSGNFTCFFSIDDATRRRLLEGLDDIALTMRSLSEIDRFERRRPTWRPSIRPLSAE